MSGVMRCLAGLLCGALVGLLFMVALALSHGLAGTFVYSGF